MNKHVRNFLLLFILCAVAATTLFWWRARVACRLREQWQQVDFDLAMDIDAYAQVVQQDKMRDIVGMHNREVYAFFKDLYQLNSPEHCAPSYAPKIPKIIHQIWLGSEVPKEFLAFIDSWQKVHPNWEYRLWRDADIQAFGLINKDLYDAAPNYGEKSDLARYEILHRLGGVYVDVDCQALQPLTILHHTYDFYIGIEPLDSTYVQVGNAIIGSVAGHPLLAQAIEQVRQHKDLPTTVLRTGPLFLTKIFVSCARQSGYTNIALPPHYFFPLKCKEPILDDGHARMLCDRWIRQGSLAVHHWAKSWSHPLFRWPKFRELSEADKWLSADFDTAMGADTCAIIPEDQLLLELFRSLYEKDKLSNAFLTQGPRLPKVIHQVWFGAAKSVQLFNSMESWRKHNPHWQYKLWSLAEVQELIAPYRALFDAADDATKALIAGYAILHAHGGVFVATDLQCVQPIDCLNHAYNFYASLQPFDTHQVRLGTGVVAASAGHPIIARCLATLENALKNSETHLTQAFVETQKKDICIGLPASYFYAKAENKNQPGVFAVTC